MPDMYMLARICRVCIYIYIYVHTLFNQRSLCVAWRYRPPATLNANYMLQTGESYRIKRRKLYQLHVIYKHTMIRTIRLTRAHARSSRSQSIIILMLNKKFAR